MTPWGLLDRCCSPRPQFEVPNTGAKLSQAPSPLESYTRFIVCSYLVLRREPWEFCFWEGYSSFFVNHALSSSENSSPQSFLGTANNCDSSLRPSADMRLTRSTDAHKTVGWAGSPQTQLHLVTSGRVSVLFC